ncbi:phosphinothricin acetyltransferase [Natronospira proteinivora]|uniref:Phosphinothricin acetyltransferase n=2 Tax=Natronospira proteinivora TaxID=1807133 RepID=A0ABT1G588_9GAMM|nr:phosphinothricin acetyltransferase [Natronospira proteinivora]
MRSIFLAGIATGQASFETEATLPQCWDDFTRSKHPESITVIHDDMGRIAAWGALAPTSTRYCYRGVAEVQLYVAPESRGHGLGARILADLIRFSETYCLWTLQAVVFPENRPSIQLFEAHGFRQVGYREKIAQMNGEWRDTLLFERRSPHIK